VIEFGLTPSEFREGIREQAPRLLKGALRGGPFSWSELDAALHHIEPVPPVFQLFNGGIVREDQYADIVGELGAPRRRLNKRRFFAQLRSGATLVVNGFENYSLRALALCNEVRRFSGWRTAGNAYLSFGGRGTFGQHWDTHDVFAIQLIGQKRWRVYPPTFPLPLDMHTSESSGATCPTTPVLECTLETGDVLYVPRGFWHHVIPTDGPSLHLSVGTYAPAVHDFVMWACARRLPAQLAARRSLTPALERSALEDALGALGDILLSATARAEFEREIATSERVRSALDTEIFLAAGADGLTPAAVLRLNSTRELDPTQPEVRVNGTLLRLHPLPRSIIASLREGPLPLASLCEQLAPERPDAIRAAVLDLVQHELVAIERA
jgi:ribosomal protein L16 Arg81 hydroxylase